MLKTPSAATLKKYGLSEAEWRAMADAQDHACFVCRNEPSTGRLCIDHFHRKGWKKLPPEKRKLYVRGLLCWVCNHYYCGRSITVEKSERVTLYLRTFEEKLRAMGLET